MNAPWFPSILLHRQHDRASRNENSAKNSLRRKRLVQKRSGENQDKDDAQFVDWRDLGGFTELQGSEITLPRQAGSATSTSLRRETVTVPNAP